MRSKLFVPASRPEFFDKALSGDADAVSFDLEDAVPADGKAAARARLAGFLGSDAARASDKRIIVRVNATDSAAFANDLAAMAVARVDLINLPKIEDAEQLGAAVVAITAAEAASGRSAPVDLLITIETPRALANAAAIAAADPRVVGLQVGLNDLFATLGIDRRDPRHVHAALFAIRMAAGAAGVFAYDGAWPDIADDVGFEAEAATAASLGFLGKSCVHPRQVALANAAFGVSASRLTEAARIVAGAEIAAAEGKGAFLLDGRMIDRPDIARAEALLAANHGARP